MTFLICLKYSLPMLPPLTISSTLVLKKALLSETIALFSFSLTVFSYLQHELHEGTMRDPTIAKLRRMYIGSICPGFGSIPSFTC